MANWCVFTIFIIAASSVVARSQDFTNYQVRKTYGEKSTELIASVKGQLNDEIKRTRSKNALLVKEIYTKRTQVLVSRIKQGSFIHDDTLEHFVSGVVDRLTTHNNIVRPPRRILILKSAAVNAFCYGEGTFMISIGLLRKIRNESELAFALAHEFAHYELDHVRIKIETDVERKLSKTIRKEANRIVNDEMSVEEIDAFRNLIYEVSRYERKMELQADSLGLIFFTNAKYHHLAPLTLLEMLDSAEHAKYPSRELFAPFYSVNYPFQEFWLKERLSIFNKKSTNTFIFENDSIESHPDVSLRKRQLSRFIQPADDPADYQPAGVIQRVREICDYEAIQSAFNYRQYDRCLFLALQLLTIHPHDSYVVAMVSRLFIALDAARNDGTYPYIIPQFTSYYPPDLRVVNNFLQNISQKELGEIAFHFLNNQAHFNPALEQHYVLLARICKMTNRTKVIDKIKSAYRDRFPKGKLLSKL